MAYSERIGFLWLVAMVALLAMGAARADVEAGRGAPHADVLLVDGTTLSRAELRGQVVLTVFWATWCPICMRELPEYQQLRERHAAAGFEVLAISVDEDPADVHDYLKRSRLAIPVAMRTAQMKSAWGPVQGTPLLFLTDRSGMLRSRHLGAVDIEALEQELSLLLAEGARRQAVPAGYVPRLPAQP